MSTALPDMIVTSIGSLPSIVAGQPVTFSATIANQGAAGTPDGVVIGIAFLVDGTEVTWSDNYSTSLAPETAVTLPANNGPAGTATWTATAGDHTLVAHVNDIGRFSESSTTNNTLSTTFPVAAPSTPPPPAAPAPGTPYVVLYDSATTPRPSFTGTVIWVPASSTAGTPTNSLSGDIVFVPNAPAAGS